MREMKESSTLWIGEIPKEWKIIKNKYLITMIYSGGTPSATNENFYCQEDGTPFVSIGDMSNCSYVTTTKKHITELGIQDKKLQILPKGTILYSIYATIGAISELKIEATISQAMLAIKVNSKILKSFYKYNLEAMKDYIFSNASGNTQFNLNAEKVRNFYFVQPPLSEQHRISDYLDNKCTKIDSIIEKQEKVIEKLKAYKLSVITEAVTKGLKPDVPMKDSGVEWIGEIPEVWQLSHIGNLAEIGSGGTPDRKKPEYWTGGTIPWMSSGEINLEYVNETSEKITVLGMNNSNAKLLPKNTVMLGLIGQGKTKGLTAILNIECTCNQNLAYLIPNDFLYYKFLFYCFKAMYFYIRGLVGDSQAGIYQNFLKKRYIPLPIFDEQQQIAEYLDKKCSAIDSAIKKKQAIIEKLKEYKKSLIYEVVTGKKEV